MAGNYCNTSTQQQQQPLQLRLMVDKRKMRLVYAECDRAMADVLFSFLTTPVGALARRTGKNSGLGWMDSLYRSVEDMDAGHFHSPACRELLLRPRDAWGAAHHRLQIRINDVAEICYRCSSPSTLCPLFATLPGAKCVCGFDMDVTKYPQFPRDPKGENIVFVRRGLHDFVVTDDLFVVPSSASIKRKLCKFAGVEGPSSLEQLTVLVGFDQVLQLMKLSISSNTPLTDAFLPSNYVQKTIQFRQKDLLGHLTKTSYWSEFMSPKLRVLLRKFTCRRKIEIVVLHNPKRTKILLAIAGRKFVDFLFSFLIFPFGSIVAALDGHSPLGCMDNLHQAMKKLVYDGNSVAQEPYDFFKRGLINPSIPPHHYSQKKLLKIGSSPCPLDHIECDACQAANSHLPHECIHGRTNVRLKVINPKCSMTNTRKGGEFIQRPQTFFITNTLAIKPVSDISSYPFLGDFEERKIVVGQKEALELLRASLICEDPLTSAFLKLL